MAKLKATDIAKRAALEGMQMMGGYGYTTEFDMERHLRAAVVRRRDGRVHWTSAEPVGKRSFADRTGLSEFS